MAFQGFMSNPVLVRISERDDQSKADTTDTVLAVRIVCFLPTLEQVLSDMRLLNTGSSELREFVEKATPPYAILSHRWGEQEILYQDMIPSANRSTTQNKYGYGKLRDSCNLAQRQGYRWIWIDTCCIDKSSSAELTEAINSMYQWYEAAEVCYAYLNDARTVDDLTESKWFTRGWTLQELIAPDKVEFYSRSWQFLGTKRSLARSIAAKSGVDVQVLMGGDPLEMSVARRMYWASNRVTTRLEDEAYCLLGLFGVNMPLIYGEGRKAFRRLQEEIIRLSDDPSILAWYATNESDGTPVDFLASRPSDFLESGDIAAYPYRRTRTEAMMITSQGLSLEIVLLSFRRDETATTEDGQLFGEATAILDCQIGSIPGTFPTIILRRQSSRGRCGGRKHYYRIVSSGFKSLFSTERTQFESCDTRALRDETKLVIGLDPTQLDQNVYKESLDKSSDYVPWRHEQVIISRPSRLAFRQRFASHAQSNQFSWAPWSLLLTSSAEADQRPFWFVLYVEPHYSWPKLSIVDVYPSARFDFSSRQLHTDPIPWKYYNLNRFKVIDGIVELSVVTIRPVKQVYSCPKLLVGRQASSRRQTPEPWCQFDGSLEFLLADQPHADFIAQYEAGWPAPDGLKNTSHTIFSDSEGSKLLRASVREKEISGVVHYVVAVEFVHEDGIGNQALILQREDRPDRRLEATENHAGGEPLILQPRTGRDEQKCWEFLSSTRDIGTSYLEAQEMPEVFGNWVP